MRTFDVPACVGVAVALRIHNNTSRCVLFALRSLRKLLKIKKWQVFGGSWGSCLGLTYAESVSLRACLPACLFLYTPDVDTDTHDSVGQIRLPRRVSSFLGESIQRW